MADSRAIGGGFWLVTDGDKSWRVAIVQEGNGTWFFVDGQVGFLPHQDPSRGRAKGRGDTGVMAPMPATVVAINATAGQTVNEGDTLIVLEAMKMELPIKSPRTGVVKAIHCAKGDLVQPGVSLLDIE